MNASEPESMIGTGNGKPTAVLLSVQDEDELEGLVLAYSPRFRAILQAARAEIRSLYLTPKSRPRSDENKMELID